MTDHFDGASWAQHAHTRVLCPFAELEESGGDQSHCVPKASSAAPPTSPDHKPRVAVAELGAGAGVVAEDVVVVGAAVVVAAGLGEGLAPAVVVVPPEVVGVVVTEESGPGARLKGSGPGAKVVGSGPEPKVDGASAGADPGGCAERLRTGAMPSGCGAKPCDGADACCDHEKRQSFSFDMLA